MASEPTQYKYLERDRLSSYRQLSMKGRRIRARTLYGLFMSAEEPMMVEEIAADYDLPVEAVHEAIAYCKSKPLDIELDFLQEEMMVELSGMNRPDYNGKPKLLTAEDRALIRRTLFDYATKRGHWE
jgi:uncharacterized protein (DUF433 family)